MDKNRKVLIVEDNELNMKLFKDILESEDCMVIECFDPMFALEIISKERPNLILMDIQLPRISGLDLIKWIKGDANIPTNPIGERGSIPNTLRRPPKTVFTN